MKLGLRYETVYSYEEPVSFSPHDLRLFPRTERFSRVRRFELQANGGGAVRYGRDAFDNVVASCFYPERMTALRFELQIDLELEEKDAFDFILENCAVEMPFAYAPELEPVLAPFRARQTSDELTVPGWQAPTANARRATVSTLVGAGSHLIANDLLEEFSDERISFAEWALYGIPFGLAAALVSCLVISRMLLGPATRALPLTVPTGPQTAWSRSERRTAAVTLTMVALWVSESVHGIEVATVAVAGAVALTAPGIGVLTWKDGVKAVEWNLVVFVGAALVLGEALIDTGAAGWIVERLFAASGIAEAGSELVVLLVLTLLTLTSHVYMTSHAARAAALVPALLYLGTSLDLDPVALVFIGTVGMDYCLTFPVSSKALLLYAELDEDTFEPPDLLRLSSVLLLAHVVLVVVFYHAWWSPLGLAL